jgi:hypothetical protein
MQTKSVCKHGRSYLYNNGDSKVKSEKKIQLLSQKIRVSNSTVSKICRDDLSFFPCGIQLSYSLSDDRRDAFATFNVATERLALLLRIREASGSCLGSKIVYFSCHIFCGFSLFFRENP